MPKTRRSPAGRFLSIFARALVGFLLAAAPGWAETGPADQLSGETQLETASGAKFPVASGWWVTRGDGRIVLETPERDMTIWFLELTFGPEIADGEAAIREGWRQVRPDFALPVERATTPPPTGGWEAITQIGYITPTEENRSVVGVARLAGERWYVQVLDGSNGAFDRRGAQLGAALNGLTPPGLDKESFAGRTAHKLDAARLAQYRAFLEQARVDARVPGVAVAIVEDGKVVFEEGLGVRELGASDPITPETLFMIGSTTKSLTSLLMAVLVDLEKLEWDTPVTQLLPDFALGDAEMTSQLTLRHTVCACTGLPRQDMEFIFEFADATAEIRLATMRGMKPTTGFGETFQYSNTLVAAGGYAAGRSYEPNLELSSSYAQALQQLVLTPLRMPSTTLDHPLALSHPHASPHGVTISLEPVPFPPDAEGAVVAVGPAGGAWSNLRDMEKLLLLELSDGLGPDGVRVVSVENLHRRREPQVKVSDTLNYGLGLFTGLETGAQICHHGGNTLGFTSDFFFLPEHGVGAVVLTNVGAANAFRSAARRKLLELLFDGRDEAGPRLEFELQLLEKVTAEERAKLRPAEPDWVATVVGAYSDPSLGSAEIRVGTVSLESSAPPAPIFDAGEWSSSFVRRTEPDGAEKIILMDPPVLGLEFLVSKDAKGRPSFVLDLSQQRYAFERGE